MTGVWFKKYRLFVVLTPLLVNPSFDILWQMRLAVSPLSEVFFVSQTSVPPVFPSPFWSFMPLLKWIDIWRPASFTALHLAHILRNTSFWLLPLFTVQFTAFIPFFSKIFMTLFVMYLSSVLSSSKSDEPHAILPDGLWPPCTVTLRIFPFILF